VGFKVLIKRGEGISAKKILWAMLANSIKACTFAILSERRGRRGEGSGT